MRQTVNENTIQFKVDYNLYSGTKLNCEMKLLQI